MKRPIIVLLGVCVCLCTLFLMLPKKTTHSIFENDREEFENEEEEESGAEKQLESWFQARAYPDPTYLNAKYLSAWEQAQAIRQNHVSTRNQKMASASWTSIGPNQTIGGRTLSIAIDPNNSNNIFIGTASGGIYKTTNATTTCSWTYVPIPNYPVVGVASIVYHPSNSNILLAGTGEVYRSGNSNIGFNVWKARGTYGIGILKTTDGGSTWTRVFNKNTSDLWAVQMLKYDPSNSNIVYAAATDGLYKSTDGGNSWALLYSKTYVSDVAINPADGNQIVIAVGNLVDADKGIYRTTNGGSSWSKITSGLPASFSGYIRFDNVGSTRLYASIGGTTNELYLSTNFGSSWIAKSSSAHCGGQYWFGHDLAVDPSNTNHIIIGGVNYWEYNSTSTTTSSGSKVSISPAPHDDVHDIKFDPANSNIVYVACDGGMYRSTDNGGSFSNRNSGLSAVQFYASIATHPTNANIIVGGLQDNNIARWNGTSWAQYTGGDGGACAFSSNGVLLASHDARMVYQSTNGGTSYSMRLANLGQTYSEDRRTAFMAPLAISKSNPDVMYVASDNLHISTDGGSSFTRNLPSSMTRPIEMTYKTAVALAVSPTNENKVYVSTSPFSQNNDNTLNVNAPANVLKSLNASNDASYSFTSIKGTLPDRFVMDFAISPTNDDSVFVVLGGFGTSHVYVTGNGGTSWASVGSGLPDCPFNAILLDPVDSKVLYAAGDLGVYVSPNRGGVWYDYNNGLWDNAALVMDIQADANNDLVLATHGKGVFVGPRYSGTLPVSFLSFTGEALPASNELKWQVAEEFNLKHYEIQRSTNGTDFTTIATIAGTNATTYKYSDPLSTRASYYYRIMSVDFDRSYEYSSVIYLKREATEESMRVLGNPFSNNLQIRFSLSATSQAQIRLYDAGGKLLRYESPKLSAGQSLYTFNNLTMIPAGTYYVEAIVNERRWKEKVIKK